MFLCRKINQKHVIMNIGDNLRIIRNKKAISQQEIADFLGIDRRT